MTHSDNEFPPLMHQEIRSTSRLKRKFKMNSIKSKYIKFSELQQEMMDMKVFEPYFINHQTILEYQEKVMSLSIRDIIIR